MPAVPLSVSRSQLVRVEGKKMGKRWGEQRAKGGPHLVKARFWSVVHHASSVNMSQQPAKKGACEPSCTASPGLDMTDVNKRANTKLGWMEGLVITL